MAEVRQAEKQFLRRFGVRDTETDSPESEAGPTREHQSNAQAFAFTVVFKDQRLRQSFPWAMYGGHEWTDDGDMECITALFGERGCIVRGYRLGTLDRDMSLGKLVSIREHTKAQVGAMLAEDSEDPVIVSIETFPDMSSLMSVLKGDSDETGHSRQYGRQ